MAYKTLEVTIENNIAHVAMNRPDKLNAMNGTFFAELGKTFKALDADPAVRAIVLSGNGKHFTAGLDLKESASVMGAAEGDPARVRDKLRRHILWLQDSFNAVDNCRIPVIAAIHGACVGGGIDLIAACDIRIASSDAWFSIQEINVAIVADLGTLQRAPYLLPLGILKELAYTGRKMPASEAKGLGFVNHVHDDKDMTLKAAFDIAGQIAGKSPLAVSGTKAVLNHARDHTVADGLDYVATWNSGMLLGEDLMKAASAALTRQHAEFAPLHESDDPA
ncbi:crotonase/enoyl-CoA hydratase family protein [Kordiimonas sp.]|uniref:crotonase/enoyl-CoA hydratase family protein n=1 Tax=Kordiimonas sp. TaxID=1970157 RepID=UPI003A8FD701